MTGWLYRLIYRREIRERQERMAAHVEVWRQRQVENDVRWERQTARLHAFRDELRAATSWAEVEVALARVDER
jgi:hypothetical protein